MPKIKHDKTFPDRLQRLMDDAKMTRAELAREIWGNMTDERGYDVPRNRQMIGKYLHGQSYPTSGTRRKMAEALGCTYTNLFPNEAPQDRPGSGVTLTQVDRRNSQLTFSVIIPTVVALRIIDEVKDYT